MERGSVTPRLTVLALAVERVINRPAQMRLSSRRQETRRCGVSTAGHERSGCCFAVNALHVGECMTITPRGHAARVHPAARVAAPRISHPVGRSCACLSAAMALLPFQGGAESAQNNGPRLLGRLM